MSSLKPGDFIAGEYRIRRVFGGPGRSGMGVVYLVEGRTSQEPFVLKTYQSKLNDEDLLARFQIEATTWVNLGKHPNIVQCHWIRNIDHQLFLAAEYIAPDNLGRNTLTQHLASGPIPLQRQLSWMADFCFGMKHALSHGLKAHRDIKPDNLMIDNRGHLKIADFGLAKRLNHLTLVAEQPTVPSTHEGLTRFGNAVGTLPFMAPEQFVDSSSADHRTDIYSLGVVSYLMLSNGHYPICPQPAAMNSTMHWAVAHNTQQIRQIDHPLMSLSAKCLEKKASDRFQSYDSLLSAVTQVCSRSQIPIPLEESAPDEEFSRRWSLAMSLNNLGRTEEALTMIELMITKWPQASELYTEMGTAYITLGRYSEARSATERSLALNPYSTAAWNNLGGILANTNHTDEAKSAYSRSLLIEPENDGAMIGLAQLFMAEGQFRQARQMCETALFWRPEKTLVLKVAANCFLQCKEPQRASPLLEKLVAANVDDTTSWFNLSLCRRSIGDVDGHLNALLAVLERDPNDRHAFSFMVQALLDLGRTEDAIAACERFQTVEACQVLAVCKQAQILAATGESFSAYLLLKKWTALHERSAPLWFTMAIILSPTAKYRMQAQTAVENALMCHRESADQLTPENHRVLLDLRAKLATRE